MKSLFQQAEWFIARNKQKLGPFSWAALQAQARDGRLSASDMLLQDGDSKWVAADSIPGLFCVAKIVAPETLPANTPAALRQEPATASFHQPEIPVSEDTSWPRIPGYEILAEIGHGGMGVVYKAKHLPLKRLVAIKMVLSGTNARAEALVRFRAEAEAVARLQHPNIIQIHEIGNHEGRPFFSLEFAEGGTLSQKLRGDPQSPRQAAEWIETLARAVQAAHERGIVHRDLKPANVMINKDGVPKIADFGLAKQLDSDQAQTQAGAIMGTPAYMAPEQAAGKTKDIGPLCDVYALGVILYEMLTGRPPFKGETTWDTLEQVRTQEPVSPRRLQPKMPRDLETICLKCLEKDAERRYDSAMALADDLRRFLNGENVRARPLSAPDRLWRWCRRHPIVAATGALFLVAFLAMSIYWETRPAYLDIRVEPKTAEVFLDEAQVPLDNGYALFPSGPGKRLVTIRANEHLTEKRPVIMVRGRDNAALVNVRLESEYGYLYVSTTPPGASVRVYDGQSKQIEQGTTPYHSPRLLQGKYEVRFQLSLHEDANLTVMVPSGDRTTKISPLSLKSVATESQLLLAFLRKTRDDRFEVPDLKRGPLSDALQLAIDRIQFPVQVNHKALASAKKPVNLKSNLAPRIVKGDYSPQRFLRLLCYGEDYAVPTTVKPFDPSEGIGYVLKRFSANQYGLEIVSASEASRTNLLVTHPVKDLVVPNQKRTAIDMISSLTRSISPGSWNRPPSTNPFTGEVTQEQVPHYSIDYDQSTAEMMINACWKVHEDVYAHLEDLRIAIQQNPNAPVFVTFKGKIVIPGNWSCWLPTNNVAGKDPFTKKFIGPLRWSIEADKTFLEGYDSRAVLGGNKIPLAVVTNKAFDEMDFSFIKNVALTSERIPGAQLAPGTVLVFLTPLGEMAKLRVVKFYKSNEDFPEPVFITSEQRDRFIKWRDQLRLEPIRENYHIELEWVLYRIK